MNLIVIILISAAFALLFDFVAIKWTKWKTFTINLIGAAIYGGVMGVMGLSIIDPWPKWLIGLIAIIAFVIVQGIITERYEDR